MPCHETRRSARPPPAQLGPVASRLTAPAVAAFDAEASWHIGAESRERTEERTTYRNGTRDNGTRDKIVTTAVMDLTIQIPKAHAESLSSRLLSSRRRIDGTVRAVAMEAYVCGSLDPEDRRPGHRTGRATGTESMVAARSGDLDLAAW